MCCCVQPEAAGSAKGVPAAKPGLLSSFIGSLKMSMLGKGALTKEDLGPALLDMKRKLMERNVAEGIAARCTFVSSVSVRKSDAVVKE